MKLDPLECAVLAVAGSREQGISQYDLKAEILKGTAPLLGASVSAARKALLELEKSGHLEALEPDARPGAKPGARRGPIRYRLNLRGSTALKDWAATVPYVPSLNGSELLARMRAAPLVPTELTVVALEEAFVDLMTLMRNLEAPAIDRPGSEIAARLEYDLLHTLVWAYLQWVDHASRQYIAQLDEEQAAAAAAEKPPPRPLDRETLEARIAEVRANIAVGYWGAGAGKAGKQPASASEAALSVAAKRVKKKTLPQ